MSRGVTIVLALGVGLLAGIPLGGRLMAPGSAPARRSSACRRERVCRRARCDRRAGHLRTVRRGRLAEGSEHAARPREVDVWGAARHLRREPESRVPARRRRAAEPAAARSDEAPEIGPNVQFPVGGLPWRNANTATAPPGAGGTGQDPAKGMEIWRGARRRTASSASTPAGSTASSSSTRRATSSRSGRSGTRCSSARTRSTSARTIREKHVWVVDDHTHAIYKFTNDGKQLVQTIGTPNVPGADGTHFNRPTFMAWVPDGSFYVADGYNGTRVAKFDADGKFLLDLRHAGRTGGKETRPGYMNNVHGVAVDHVETRRVFVNDRDNHRIQIFDENGKYLSEWKIAVSPSSLHFVQIGADRHAVDLRSQHAQDAEVRPRRPSAVRVGHRRRFPRHAVGRARHEHGPGRQPLRRGSGLPAASRSSARARAPIRRT